MVKQYTQEEILGLNPHVDKEELEKSQRVLRTLRADRVRQRHFVIPPPFDRPRVTVGENDKTDYRTITLRRTNQ